MEFVCQVHGFSIVAPHLERKVLLLHLVISTAFLQRALALPSRTCLYLMNSWSFAMDILLSFCLGS